MVGFFLCEFVYTCVEDDLVVEFCQGYPEIVEELNFTLPLVIYRNVLSN